MARARNIKPGFYKNPELVECSVWARLIFPGLWMLADREGRLEDRPKQIKMELLPADQQDVDPLLRELEERGFLVRYRNEDGRFIQIANFHKHQSPHFSEKDSVIKPPNDPRNPPASTGVDSENDGASRPQDSKNSEPTKQPDSGSPPRKGRSSRGGRNPLNPDSLNPDSLNPEEAPPLRGAPPSPAAAVDGDKPMGIKDLEAEGIPRQVASDWLKVRRAKKAPLTRTAWEAVEREAATAGLTPAQAVKHAAEQGWQGFRASWYARERADAAKTAAAALATTTDVFAGAA